MRRKKLVYSSFTNKAPTDISYAEENKLQEVNKDAEILRLGERISFLEGQLKQKDKEIQRLGELNKYLYLSNSAKMDMIEKERKIKQVNFHTQASHAELATPKLQEVTKLSSFSKKHKTTLQFKQFDEIMRPSSGHKKANLDRLKTGVYHLSTLEETFKISNVIDP